MINTHFISIDWGTSNIRVRYIEIATLLIIEETTSSNGIKTIHDAWMRRGGDRELYYATFLKSQINQFNSNIIAGTMIVISGMASSSIGLRELPYTNLPVEINGNTIYSETITHSHFPYPIHLISGVKSEDDVIRGEEIELLGLIDKNDTQGSTIFITPGTHSKHILVERNFITNFHTYMTGELFNILSNHSILKNAIHKSEFNHKNNASFSKGVLTSAEGNTMLNSLFKTRTNILFEKQTKEENYYYLSGLLIGEELSTLKHATYDTLKLCAGGNLFELYLEAIKTLNLFSKTKIISKETVDKAAVKGQWKTIKHLYV